MSQPLLELEMLRAALKASEASRDAALDLAREAINQMTKARYEHQALLAALRVRPEVQRFALLMEAQLRANDHKPGWHGIASPVLLHRLREETEELAEAISTANRDCVVHEAADVANFAMMIADNCQEGF